MNPYLLFILAVISIGFVLDTVVALLNLRSLDPSLPTEFRDIFDEEKYAAGQNYTRTTTRFSLVQGSITTLLTVAFLLAGGFNWIDSIARAAGHGPIITGLLFTGLLVLLAGLVNLPFSVYATFVIEERFGFNKTTPTTFVLDLLKSIFLGVILGGPILAFVLWFFETGGNAAWLWSWLAVTAFIVVLQFLAPVWIMPLFNKFTPLPEGELKALITDYARAQNFTIQGIYTMDGSKRSSKANAFFTGFGRFRRIVFFDTLTDILEPPEILAVLAHEMGHYKHGHIFKMMALSIAQSGLMFYLLSLFINNDGLFAAFGMEHLSVYASLIFFSFLYSPLSQVLAVILNGLSRRHEREADAWVQATLGSTADLISALKKLSSSNLTNLTPHPLHVLLNYSHPPVLDRIRSLRAMEPPAKTPAKQRVTCDLCRRSCAREEMTDTGGRLLCRACRAEEESCGCADD